LNWIFFSIYTDEEIALNFCHGSLTNGNGHGQGFEVGGEDGYGDGYRYSDHIIPGDGWGDGRLFLFGEEDGDGSGIPSHYHLKANTLSTLKF